MTDRKLLVLPVACGTIGFATEDYVSIECGCVRVDVRRSSIVGRQPRKNEQVLVLDVQDLIDALRDEDCETGFH